MAMNIKKYITITRKYIQTIRGHHFTNEHGITMIELLVAVAIFGIIIAGSVQFFSSNYRSYVAQEEIAAMQQNVRFAKMFLERDIRMAGYGIRNLFVDGVRVSPVIFANGAGAGGSDRITINYLDDSSANSCNILPQLTLTDNMPTSSSEAVVNELFDDGVPNPNGPDIDNWYFSFTCNGVTYGKKPPFVEFPVLITAPDGSMSDVITITNVQKVGGNKIKLQNRPINGAGKTINVYPAGSIIRFVAPNQLANMSVVYEIANNTLMRNGQPMALNIEDLQFAFCGDYNNDNVVDVNNPADWINNRNLTVAEQAAVRYIRLSVLGRTARQLRDLVETRPAIEDHNAATAKDTFRRRLLQVTVQVRNLAL